MTAELASTRLGMLTPSSNTVLGFSFTATSLTNGNSLTLINIEFTPNPNVLEFCLENIVLSDINVGDDSFIDIINNLFSDNGYNSTVSLERYTAFPNDEGEFMDLFYDEPRNKIKNPNKKDLIFKKWRNRNLKFDLKLDS